MRGFATAIIAITSVLLLAAPASAVTDGQPDDGEHPYVGELLFFDADYIDSRFDDPGGWFGCTGASLARPSS
jgi:hypothetical protein